MFDLKLKTSFQHPWLQKLGPWFFQMSAWLFAALSPLANGNPSAPTFHGRDLTGYPLNYDFTLKDPDGKDRKLADFREKVVQIFFGFTQCPAICPTALIRAKEIKRLLGPEGEKLQVIFVTVDPERDTPEVLRSYTTAFDPSFLGLYTDEARLKELSANFKFFYSKVPTGSSYTMDHSAISYVFDPQGKIRLVFSHNASGADCADDVRQLLKGK